MTRWLWLAGIVLALLLPVALGVLGGWWWRSPLPYTELDKAIVQAGWRPYADVTDIVIRHVPADFDGAAKALLDFGFREGPSYGPPPLPGTGQRDRYINDILEQHDAVFMRRFGRSLPSRSGNGLSVYTYLMKTPDGSMRAVARKGGGKW